MARLIAFGGLMNILRYRYIFWQLLKVDLLILYKDFYRSFINASIWSLSVVFVSKLFLSSHGIVDFAIFQAMGACVSIAAFDLYPRAASFLADLEGDDHFSYQLSLPLPGWLLCVKTALVCMINGILLGSVVFVVSKLVFWSTFDLINVNPIKALIALMVINSFFGFFLLFVISLTKKLSNLRDTWMRVLYPLWFFGGFQFTWHAFYVKSPWLSYVALLNPYLYAQEGLRGAMLGQADFINFWLCMIALVSITIIMGFISLVLLRKRLDFI